MASENYNSGIRAFVAILSAAAMLLVNVSTALAASFVYNAEVDVEGMVLSDYLMNETMTESVENGAPEVIRASRGAELPLGAVTYADITVDEEIAFETVEKTTSRLAIGKSVTVTEGVPGVLRSVYRVKYINGIEDGREVVSSYVVSEPVAKVVQNGTALPAASDGRPSEYSYVLECEASAYDMSPEQNGGYGGQSATGVPLDKGIIAVDPKVIPLGSRVYIEALDGSWSYGYALAADTGGAIKGNRVDLCYRTNEECIQFGRRKCRVYVL